MFTWSEHIRARFALVSIALASLKIKEDSEIKNLELEALEK